MAHLELLFIELHLGIQPLPCLWGLRKSPVKPNIVSVVDDRAERQGHSESLEQAFSLRLDYQDEQCNSPQQLIDVFYMVTDMPPHLSGQLLRLLLNSVWLRSGHHQTPVRVLLNCRVSARHVP